MATVLGTPSLADGRGSESPALRPVCSWPRCPPGPASQVLSPLKPELESLGYTPAQADALLNAKGVRFEAGLMAALLAPKESSLNYAQFLDKQPVAAPNAS